MESSSMNKLFKFMTIAAVGVAIGTVASKIVKPDRTRINKITKPASDQDNQLNKAGDDMKGEKDLDDLDNCFI